MKGELRILSLGDNKKDVIGSFGEIFRNNELKYAFILICYGNGARGDPNYLHR